MRFTWMLLAPAIALSGCGLVYKQDVQQGNVLEQGQIDMLAPGMTRRQVQLVLGTPAVTDPFHRGRWDYVAYSIPEDEDMQKLRQISLYFEGNKLVRIEGNLKPTGAKILGEAEIEEQVESVQEGGNAQALGNTQEPRPDDPDPPLDESDPPR